MRVLESFQQQLPTDVVKVRYRVYVSEGTLSITRELSNAALIAAATAASQSTWDEHTIAAVLSAEIGEPVTVPGVPDDGEG